MAVSSEGNWLSQPQRQLSQAFDGVDEGLAVHIDEAVNGASLSKPKLFRNLLLPGRMEWHDRQSRHLFADYQPIHSCE